MTVTPTELRRALAFNAVGPALNERGEWLPLSVRQAVADAVLTAVDAAHLVAATGAQALTDRDRAEFYEAALARMRDRAEVAAVHAERANAQLLALLGEAVDWIHEGELRDRIVAALNPQEQTRA